MIFVYIMSMAMGPLKRSYIASFKHPTILQYDEVKNYTTVASNIVVDHKTIMEWVKNRKNSAGH
jgi:hypothetical protein